LISAHDPADNERAIQNAGARAPVAGAFQISPISAISADMEAVEASVPAGEFAGEWRLRREASWQHPISML
jgi:hypothetical protein